MIRNLNVLFVLLLVMGCSQLGLTQPKDFSERLAYAYGTHTSVVKATTQKLNSKGMTSAEAEQVLTIAKESRGVLDTAEQAAAAGDITTANAKLLLATGLLTQLQAYLNKKEK